MGTELLNQLPVSAAHHAQLAVAPDPEFDTRWAAWIASRACS